MTTSHTNASTGSKGCSCINVTDELLSLTDLKCTLPNGNNGFRFAVGGTCLDYSYGSNYCLQHDLLYDDKACNVDEAGENVIPSYCFRPWCYVDAPSCGRDSEERAFQSSYLPFSAGVDVHYSYSTCNSTADDWISYAATSEINQDKLGGVNIRATIPYYQIPSLFKTVDGEKTVSQGDEYYNDSIPFEGIFPAYVQKIADITNGDIQNIAFTHRTRASSIVHPYSSATAAVQDVADGLSDMVVGPIWVTGQRLGLTAFTIPFVMDRSYLVVPREGSEESLTYEVQKVLAPFSLTFWVCILLVIILAAALSVWFWVPPHSGGISSTQVMARKKKACCRLCLDNFLEKFTFFTSAGVEQDPSASLPTKILMFGFGFFILITVSAYVANLAAFLTMSGDRSVKSMEAAVELNIPICAHPAIEQELRDDWPGGNFYFHEDGNEFRGILNDYDEGKCKAMIVGWEDTAADIDLLNMFCERNLAFTGAAIAEIPMAFPIRSQLAPGFSYHLYNAQKYHDISSTTVTQNYLESNGMVTTCDLQISAAENESSDTTPIETRNMILPLLLFGACAIIAAAMQMIYERQVKNTNRSGRSKPKSALGRVSTLNLFRGRSFDEKHGKKDSFEENENEIQSAISWNQESNDDVDFFDAQEIGTEENGVSNVATDFPGVNMAKENSRQSEKKVTFDNSDRRLSLERS